MKFLMLFSPDLAAFDPYVVESAFRSRPEFNGIRTRTPVGTPVECDYIERDDRTIIRLSGDATTIAIDHTWGAALRAALIVQECLGVPLRMVNDDDTFDLTFSNISTIEELEAVIEGARTS